jgi:hypothetical protein
MPIPLATAVVLAALGYLAIGAMVALAFVAAGLARVDPAARGAGWAFRLLIFPGAAAFWPLIAAKWARALRRGAP